MCLDILKHPSLLLHDGHHMGVLLLKSIEHGLNLEKHFQEGTVQSFKLLTLGLHHVRYFIHKQLKEVDMTFL